MPSIGQQSVRAMVVMIRTPFEKSQQRRRHERHSQGYSWDNRQETPRDIPGSKGRQRHGQPSSRLRTSYAGLACLQTAFGMEIAGTTTVPASPPGPGNKQLHTAWRRPDQASKQMTHFRNRQGKQRSRITSRPDLWDKHRGSQGDVLGADRDRKDMSQ